MKRALFIAVIGTLLLLPGTAPVSAQAPDGPLTFFQNYFVTGDYVVGSTGQFRKGLNGLATGDIDISGVPDGAEVLAAYLYVQTTISEGMGEDAGIAGATFKGNALNLAGGPIPKPLNWASGTQACLSYGRNQQRNVVVYRADVLRFLEIGADGKHQVNGPHQVQAAEFGSGDDHGPNGPKALSASLVVVYRHPDPGAPMRSVVIYDGGVTRRTHEPFSQTIQGFYEPTAQPEAKMTHIVGRGQGLFLDRVKINGQLVPNMAKPSNGGAKATWNHKTFDLADSALLRYPALTTVSVDPRSCLSWSAIVVSTKVQDFDDDGLLDIWESPGDIFDPTGQKLPNLNAMGANPSVKDLFFEIGYLHTPGYNETTGSGPSIKYGNVWKPGHSHLPTEAALKLVWEAFDKAPDGPIRVHFDVGNNYQTSPYVIPSALALGGRGISETLCPGPTPDSIQECEPGETLPGQYPLHPGTVGWKTGYRFYRDEILGFDRGRKDIFRYALFAHSLGLPVSEFPCLDNGTPAPYTDGLCADEDNLDFHKPKTNSGVADWAGGDILVTLGGFDDSLGRPVGTDFMQASTLMHEFGHNARRRHGGDLFEPNCKPLYLSVMNYLYQLRGLPDALGVPRLDFSRGFAVPPVLSELALSDEDFQSDAVEYRIGWYAPKGSSYLNNQLGGAATKHCDGSPLLTDADGNPTEPEMVRLDATKVGGLIDWNADGKATFNAIQDINFDGFPQEALTPSTSDWAQLRLNQLGARRSVGGLFLDKLGRPTVGPMSLNTGKGDLGKGDLGKGDLGKGDLGKGDLGKGDLGKGDLGKGDLGKGDLGVSVIVALTLGKGDLGKGDLGGGDLDVGGPGEPQDAIDVPTANAVTGGNPTPPSALCVTDDDFECVEGGAGDIPVRLKWLVPNVGRPLRYLVYRFEYDPEQSFPPETLPTVAHATVSGTEGGLPPTTYVDTGAPAGSNLAYFLRAVFFDGESDEEITSGISNFATVQTPGINIVDLGISAPPAALGFQSMTPFDDTRENATETDVPSPLGDSLSFGAPVVHRTVNGIGFAEGGWRTWSHGYTGDVYYSGVDSTSLTMTLPPGTTAFYFYAEPRNFGLFTFTVTTTDGGTFVASSGDVLIEGDSGAHGFGFHAASTTIASITVMASSAANGFAVGEFGIAKRVP